MAPQPEARLKSLLRSVDTEAGRDLDQLYTIALEISTQKWTPAQHQFFRSVLAAIVTSCVVITDILGDTLVHNLLLEPTDTNMADRKRKDFLLQLHDCSSEKTFALCWMYPELQARRTNPSTARLFP